MKKSFILVFIIVGQFLFAQQKKVQTSKEYQEELNLEYADSLKSPLTKQDLAVFKSLDFFAIDEKYIVKATFVKAKKEKAFQMKTSTTRLPLYKKYGVLHFEIDGKQYVLNVYQNIDLIKRKGFEDYLFLPFSDVTNGKETYIGGRYIDMRIQKSDEWVIDFNKAYNPYCAYNHKYSCPIVPLENDLEIAIVAGVKKFHD